MKTSSKPTIWTLGILCACVTAGCATNPAEIYILPRSSIDLRAGRVLSTRIVEVVNTTALQNGFHQLDVPLQVSRVTSRQSISFFRSYQKITEVGSEKKVVLIGLEQDSTRLLPEVSVSGSINSDTTVSETTDLLVNSLRRNLLEVKITVKLYLFGGEF